MRICALALICLLMFSINAQADFEPGPAPSVPKLFFSAYTFPALKIWLYSSPLIIGARLYREDTVKTEQREIARNRPLRESSRIGDYGGQMYLNVAYVLGASIAGSMGDNSNYQNAKAMFWASAMSGIAAQILKHAVREERPRYEDSPDEPRPKVSFPSGHTTSAFAFASVVQQYHGWAWGAPAYAFATFVGASRMNDNQHYLHDVIFGAVLGTAYGIGVSNLYYRPKFPSTGRLLIEPTPAGTLFAYRWSY